MTLTTISQTELADLMTAMPTDTKPPADGATAVPAAEAQGPRHAASSDAPSNDLQSLVDQTQQTGGYTPVFGDRTRTVSTSSP